MCAYVLSCAHVRGYVVARFWYAYAYVYACISLNVHLTRARSCAYLSCAIDSKSIAKVKQKAMALPIIHSAASVGLVFSNNLSEILNNKIALFHRLAQNETPAVYSRFAHVDTLVNKKTDWVTVINFTKKKWLGGEKINMTIRRILIVYYICLFFGT